MAESVRIKFKGEDKVSPTVSRINSSLGSLGSKISSIGKSFNKVNKALVLGFTAITGAVAVLGIKAIKSFGEFDRQIKRVQVLAGGTEEDFKSLMDTAFRLGSSTAFSAQEVAEAFEEFAKAGFSVTQILKASESTLGLATAGNINLAEAVNISVAALNAFGREADDMNGVATILTTSFTNSAQTLEDLGQALKFVAPLASSLGISLEEVNAALGTLANVGLKGSIAGTSLNQAMLTLLKPTTKSSEVMEDLGVQFFSLDEAGQAASATIRATKDEFNQLRDRVRESDIVVASLGSQLAETKRELKGLGSDAGAFDGLSGGLTTLQNDFDEARLKNKELRDALSAQESTFEGLRKQVQEGSQDFIGLRDTAKQLNDAFNEVDASRIQRAMALVQIFKVRGSRSFLTLTREIEEFDRLFNTIAATEIRTELLDESSLKKALDAQDSFASAFGITFEKLVADATKVPEGLDKALTDAKLDERARDIFRSLRDEVTDLGLDSESVEAVLSDFLPMDSIKDFRKIILLTDQDFESFLKNINATNQDAQTLNKTLLNNLGSALEELQDTVTTTFIRIGGAIAERLDLTNVVRNIQQAIEDFGSGGGVEALADKLVKMFKTIGNFFKGIKTGFSQVFTPEIIDNLKNAFVRNFGIIQNEAGNLGVVFGRILGSMVKGGAELITRVLNSDLIENASKAFKKIGSVLERLGPTIGAVATGFVLLSPILGPLFWIGGKIVSVFGFLISSVIGSGKAIAGLVGGTGKLGGAFSGMIGKITGVGATATKATAGTAGFLGKLGSIGSSISGIFSAIGSALGVSAGVAAGIVVAIVGTIIGFINQVRQNFLGLGDDFKTIFGAIWVVLKAVGSALKENLVDIGAMLKPIWEGIKDTFNGLGKILGALVASVIHPFAEGLRNSGHEGLKAGEIIKGAITLMLAPLRIALTILGSLLKAVGAIINFVATIIAGIVELGFAFQDAFRRFKTEGFSAFKGVGEVAKKIGISILKSFIGAIDSIINIFIDLINEVVNIAKKIPLLNKVIDKNFKIDKNVLGNLLGFSKEAEKTVDKIKETQDVLTEAPKATPGIQATQSFLPGINEGNNAGLAFSSSAIDSLSSNSDQVTSAAVDPFKEASIQASDFGFTSMENYSAPFRDPDAISSIKADIMSVFPSPEQASQQGREFGKFFFTGLASGMQELSGIFQQNILPIFTSMNEALKTFISTFLRNLFVLKSVPPFFLKLATNIYRIFVGGWQSTFNTIADITETIINTMQTSLERFYNNLVSIINRLISEYNRAATILARDITRTRKSTRRYTDSKGRSRTKTVYRREVLYKGVNMPKLAQFSNIKLDKLQLERAVIPQSPVTVDAGGFNVNIENLNTSSEADKQKLFSEIDAFIANKLGGLVRL